MNYSTQELTASLQEVTMRNQRAHTQPQSLPSSTLRTEGLVLSREVERFVEETQAYTARTRSVSVGSY